MTRRRNSFGFVISANRAIAVCRARLRASRLLLRNPIALVRKFGRSSLLRLSANEATSGLSTRLRASCFFSRDRRPFTEHVSRARAFDVVALGAFSALFASGFFQIVMTDCGQFFRFDNVANGAYTLSFTFVETTRLGGYIPIALVRCGYRISLNVTASFASLVNTPFSVHVASVVTTPSS